VQTGKRQGKTAYLWILSPPEVENSAITNPIFQFSPGLAGDFAAMTLRTILRFKRDESVFFS
jgi:hypothetical protein